MDSIKELLQCCNSTTLLTIAIIASIFIEIVPIKINPLSSLFKWIGEVTNKDVNEKLSSMSTRLEDVSTRIDMIEINNMRTQILDFANSCMNERRHTKEEFEHMIDLKNNYDSVIHEKGITNGRMDLAFKYISDLYIQCLNEDSFLDSRGNKDEDKEI